MRARRTITTLLTSAAVAAAVRSLPDPPLASWTPINFRGRPVRLSGGFAAALGTIAGAAVSGPLGRPAAIAAGSAMIAGGYDDLIAPRGEDALDKGFAGHFRALGAGRVSGGVVKVAVIGAGSLLAARQMPPPHSRSAPGRLVNAALIAASANLLNLFDLRPGRASKVALLVSMAGLVSGNPGPLAAVIGAGAMTLPDDLGERTMLGDLGSNAVGAVLGVRLAASSTPVRLVAGVVVGGLTLASEKVSFSRVIASVPALRWLDELGRTPIAASVAS